MDTYICKMEWEKSCQLYCTEKSREDGGLFVGTIDTTLDPTLVWEVHVQCVEAEDGDFRASLMGATEDLSEALEIVEHGIEGLETILAGQQLTDLPDDDDDDGDEEEAEAPEDHQPSSVERPESQAQS